MTKPTISAQDAKRAARNFSALVLASLFSKGLLFVWQIVLGNAFTPNEYGVFNTVSSLMAVSTSLVSFGMGLIMIREVARKPEKIGSYWASMLFLQTIFSLIAYILILLTAISSHYSQTILAFTAIGGISLMVDMFGNVGYDLLIAQEKMWLTGLIEVGHIILRVILAGIALYLGFGLMGIYIVTILSGIVRSLLLNGANLRQGNRLKFPLDNVVTRELLRDGLPIALSGFLSLAYQHADKLMTTAIIGETFTGYLGPAFVINYGMIELISTTVLVAIYPMMSRYYYENEEAFGFITEKLMRFMLIVGLPMTLVLSIFAKPIILAIYKPDYLPTASVLSILIWSTLIMMVGNVFSKGLLIQNKQRRSLMIRALSLGLNIVLNLYFLNTFRDPRGTSVATVIAEATSLTLSAYVFRAQGFDWKRVLPSVGRIVLIGALSAGTMLIVGQINVILGIGSGLMVYALGILFGNALRPDDWDLVYRLISAMPFGGVVRRFWHRDIVVNW